MIPAITKAAMNPRAFRSTANFLPSALLSIGIVKKPTMTSVVTKAEMVMTVAPERSSDPAKGKATNEGMRVMAPMIAAKSVASGPASDPISLEMVSGVSVPKVSPTMPRTVNMLGAVFNRALPAILKACLVFCLLFIRDTPRHTARRI